MITVISHFFNEEYLLPFWLEHHSKIFDHGIMIDYCSTDRSVEIIRKFCPSWTIIKTQNINEDGSPNFKAHLVDLEVINIEKTINNYKICLNVTEFLMLKKPKEETLKSISKDRYYHIEIYNVMGNHNTFFYPKNTIDFFKNITHIDYAEQYRRHRILHSDININYSTGRHGHNTNASEKNILSTEFFIVWTKFYPCNPAMFKRKLQIQKNIPQIDKDLGNGSQHITTLTKLYKEYNIEISKIKNIDTYDASIKNTIKNTYETLEKNKIYYSELFVDANWGEDNILLDNDINLLAKTDFNDCGYKIFNIHDYNFFLKNILSKEILQLTNKSFSLEKYHNNITNEEHTKILNSMPYKKYASTEIRDFSEYLENIVSEIIQEPVKIFNDDLWFRICRPSKNNDNDYNPCHRDVYLDFYRNTVNIYLPITGSTHNSSLTIQNGSHKWNENETMVTKGGAYFKQQNKKYSVDAIVASKRQIEMIRPNPSETQLMLFSPYLIHGCAINNNENDTRISLEVRFIKDDENGHNQELKFNEFIKNRIWR